MDGPKKTQHYRRVVIAVVLVLVISGASYYAYSAYANPNYTCDFVPGDQLYLHIVSSASAEPLAGLGVKGSLVELCPVEGSGSSAPQPKSTVLGNWNFTTNSTGYVSIPSSELAGWSFTFNVPYEGHIYQFNAEICGGGATKVELGLPSGSFNWTTSSLGSVFSVAKNGTQMVQNCGVGSSYGNATIS